MMHAPVQAGPDRLIDLSEVMQLTNRGKTMIYRMMRRGDFPKRCAAGWSYVEVQGWITDQLSHRNAA